jgi:hypothetical protein
MCFLNLREVYIFNIINGKENVKSTTKIQLMFNFSHTWHKVCFVALSRRKTSHIKGKKCTQKIYTLMQLTFN